MSKDFKIIFTLESVESYLHSANSLNEAIVPVACRVLNDRNIDVARMSIEDNTLRITVCNMLPDLVSIPDSDLVVVMKDGEKREVTELTLHDWMRQFNLLIVSEKTHISRFIQKTEVFKKGELDRDTIRKLCVENGYTLRVQPSGEMDLNDYVFKTAKLFYELGLKRRLLE